MGLQTHERCIGRTGRPVYDVYGRIETDAELKMVRDVIAPRSVIHDDELGGLTKTGSATLGRHFFYCPLEVDREDADAVVQTIAIGIGSFVSLRTSAGDALPAQRKAQDAAI